MAITLDQFLAALGGAESSGDYNATNVHSGAHGKYQIMPSNWPSWAAEAGLGANAPQTPENQEYVVRYKVQQYYNAYGNWEDVAAAWYSGQPLDPRTADLPQNGYPSIRSYVNTIMGNAAGMSGETYQPGGGGMPGAADAEFYVNATQQIDDLIALYQSQQPKRDDYKDFEGNFDPVAYQDALAAYSGDIASLIKARQDLVKAQSSGADDTARYNAQAGYVSALNDLGLTNYNILTGRVDQKNQNNLTRFNAATQALQTSLSYDNTNLARAAQQVGRQLGGLQESRGRADVIGDQMLRAAPYASPSGKTSFSANDLGGALGAYSRFLGMDPNAPLLNYTGVQKIDPQGLMDQYDQQFGVTGELPQVPALHTDPSHFPGAPALYDYGEEGVQPPSFIPPPAPSFASTGGGYGSGATTTPTPPVPPPIDGVPYYLRHPDPGSMYARANSGPGYAVHQAPPLFDPVPWEDPLGYWR